MIRRISIVCGLALAVGCSPKPEAAAPEKVSVSVQIPAGIEASELRGFDARWSAAVAEAKPDSAGIEQLRSIGSGATVEIYLGTWCSDSRREVGRFLKGTENVELPFEVRMFTLPREKPTWPQDERDLRFVPTFIVTRDGTEVGRIVESAPKGIENELAALLAGIKTGLITGRDDL
ncbi:MAG: hypothetical protein AAF658_10160 [Myxococcota bacterium]